MLKRDEFTFDEVFWKRMYDNPEDIQLMKNYYTPEGGWSPGSEDGQGNRLESELGALFDDFIQKVERSRHAFSNAYDEAPRQGRGDNPFEQSIIKQIQTASDNVGTMIDNLSQETKDFLLWQAAGSAASNRQGDPLGQYATQREMELRKNIPGMVHGGLGKTPYYLGIDQVWNRDVALRRELTGEHYKELKDAIAPFPTEFATAVKGKFEDYQRPIGILEVYPYEERTRGRGGLGYTALQFVAGAIPGVGPLLSAAIGARQSKLQGGSGWLGAAKGFGAGVAGGKLGAGISKALPKAAGATTGAAGTAGATAGATTGLTSGTTAGTTAPQTLSGLAQPTQYSAGLGLTPVNPTAGSGLSSLSAGLQTGGSTMPLLSLGNIPQLSSRLGSSLINSAGQGLNLQSTSNILNQLGSAGAQFSPFANLSIGGMPMSGIGNLASNVGAGLDMNSITDILKTLGSSGFDVAQQAGLGNLSVTDAPWYIDLMNQFGGDVAQNLLGGGQQPAGQGGGGDQGQQGGSLDWLWNLLGGQGAGQQATWTDALQNIMPSLISGVGALNAKVPEAPAAPAAYNMPDWSKGIMDELMSFMKLKGGEQVPEPGAYGQAESKLSELAGYQPTPSYLQEPAEYGQASEALQRLGGIQPDQFQFPTEDIMSGVRSQQDIDYQRWLKQVKPQIAGQGQLDSTYWAGLQGEPLAQQGATSQNILADLKTQEALQNLELQKWLPQFQAGIAGQQAQLGGQRLAPQQYNVGLENLLQQWTPQFQSGIAGQQANLGGQQAQLGMQNLQLPWDTYVPNMQNMFTQGLRQGALEAQPGQQQYAMEMQRYMNDVQQRQNAYQSLGNNLGNIFRPQFQTQNPLQSILGSLFS